MGTAGTTKSCDTTAAELSREPASAADEQARLAMPKIQSKRQRNPKELPREKHSGGSVAVAWRENGNVKLLDPPRNNVTVRDTLTAIGRGSTIVGLLFMLADYREPRPIAVQV